MKEIKFLTQNIIIQFNKKIEERSRHNDKMYYVNRVVHEDTIKALYELTQCAVKYHLKTEDMILTATYYLKNIIVLQALEDANHRTALYATKFFLDLNNIKTNPINGKYYLEFKNNLLMCRQKEFYTFSSLDSKILKFEENIPKEENYTFEYCLKFIKNRLLG